MIAVRDATPDDYDEYVRLFPELGVDDPIPPRERFISEMVPRTLIATNDGAVGGYLLYELLQTTGYIRNVVTDPSHRRLGVGAALMQAARDRFVGMTSWALNVKQDNTAALALYKRFGLVPQYKTTVTRLAAGTVSPPIEQGVTIAPLAPERDAEIEPRMKLLPGQLAAQRTRAGRTIMSLSRGDEILGVAVMMSIGAFPFRLVEPLLAGTFISLLRPMAAPDAKFVQFSADDEALAAELLRAGCEVHMELLHMHGPL